MRGGCRNIDSFGGLIVTNEATAMPRLLVLAIAVAIAAAIVDIAVALFVLGAAVRREDCSPALEPPAALQKNLSETGVLEPAGGTKFG